MVRETCSYLLEVWTGQFQDRAGQSVFTRPVICAVQLCIKLDRVGAAHTCARSCLRRGEADASTTLLPRTMFKAGRSRGRGIRGRAGGPLLFGEGCDASS